MEGLKKNIVGGGSCDIVQDFLDGVEWLVSDRQIFPVPSRHVQSRLEIILSVIQWTPYLSDAPAFSQNGRPPERNMQDTECQFCLWHVIFEVRTNGPISRASSLSFCPFTFVWKKICWRKLKEGRSVFWPTFDIKNSRRSGEGNSVDGSKMNGQNAKTMIISYREADHVAVFQ